MLQALTNMICKIMVDGITDNTVVLWQSCPCVIVSLCFKILCWNKVRTLNQIRWAVF